MPRPVANSFGTKLSGLLRALVELSIAGPAWAQGTANDAELTSDRPDLSAIIAEVHCTCDVEPALNRF